jgi:hypothetical protein
MKKCRKMTGLIDFHWRKEYIKANLRKYMPNRAIETKYSGEQTIYG